MLLKCAYAVCASFFMVNVNIDECVLTLTGRRYRRVKKQVLEAGHEAIVHTTASATTVAIDKTKNLLCSSQKLYFY